MSDASAIFEFYDQRDGRVLMTIRVTPRIEPQGNGLWMLHYDTQKVSGDGADVEGQFVGLRTPEEWT